jgi:hypothetical protein
MQAGNDPEDAGDVDVVEALPQGTGGLPLCSSERVLDQVNIQAYGRLLFIEVNTACPP